jgi:Rod binding domain-containing protein
VTGLDVSATSPGVPVPADVRAAGRGAEEAYRAAMGFERLLVGELAKAMSAASGADDGDRAGTGAGASPHRDLLPDALADAVTNAGGIGMARGLYMTLRNRP